MTDTFLVLMLPGAGDELQGLKKGVLELADIAAVNKADGDNLPRAKAAAASLKAALNILAAGGEMQQPPVLTFSALTGDGIAQLWNAVLTHRERLSPTGIAAKRRAQRVRAMWALIDERMRERLRTDAKLKAKLPALEAGVAAGKIPPAQAADEIGRLLGL
jgi:LAO/AO transport system kinase